MKTSTRVTWMTNVLNNFQTKHWYQKLVSTVPKKALVVALRRFALRLESTLKIFPWTGKIIFLRHENILRGSGKILEKREKIDFVLAKHAVSQGTKVMAKISARKLILCELLRLHFKRKNNNINDTYREKLVLY